MDETGRILKIIVIVKNENVQDKQDSCTASDWRKREAAWVSRARYNDETTVEEDYRGTQETR